MICDIFNWHDVTIFFFVQEIAIYTQLAYGVYEIARIGWYVPNWIVKTPIWHLQTGYAR